MYKQLDHPADLYFEVVGNNLNEIFADSASAILDYIGKVNLKSKTEEKNLIFEGLIEDILIEYLNEILFEVIVREKYLVKVSISIDKDWQNNTLFKAYLSCTFKKTKEVKREIKAVSYHMAKLEIDYGKLIFRFIADI